MRRPSPTALPAYLIVLGGLCMAFASPSSAKAYEDQLTLALDLGYQIAPSADVPAHGVAAGLSTSIGLTDAWSFRGRLGYASHVGTPSAHVFDASAEVYYLLDILQLVPFFGVGAGYVGTLSDGTFGSDVAFHAILGLDYLISRRVLVGLDVRPKVLPFALAELGLAPFALSATLRLGLVFER